MVTQKNKPFWWTDKLEELKNLLKIPNKRQTWGDLIREGDIDYFFYGNVFFWCVPNRIENTIVEVHRLNHKNIISLDNDKNTGESYKVDWMQHTENTLYIGQIKIPVEQVIKIVYTPKEEIRWES